MKELKGLTDVIHKYKNFFFDLDGVLWCGQQSIVGSLDALNMLRKQSKNLFFITNSSVRGRKQLVTRFQRYGFKVNKQECFPSSYISGLYLTSKHPQIKKIMAFGSKYLVNELQAAGLEVKHIVDLPEYQFPIDIQKNHMDETIQGIVVGWDNSMTFNKTCLIGFHLQKGVKFFGTNPDKYTMIGGYKVPGAGSIIQTIQTATGLQAQIMGKPNTFIIDQIIKQKQLIKEQCVMIGDNMQTDITFGNSAKIDTICVLTGVSKEEDVLISQGIRRPTYYAKHLTFQK